MTIAIVDHLHEWTRKGNPTTPERRQWAIDVFNTLSQDAHRQYAPQEERDARNADRPKISGSSYKHCARQLWYKARGYEERDPGPDAPGIWAIGNMHEAVVLYRIIASGLNVLAPGPDGKQHVCSLGVDGETYYGHADLVLIEGLKLGASHEEIVAADKAGAKRYVVEVKSLNPFTFDDWKNGPRIKGGRGRDASKGGPNNQWGYVTQGNFYGEAEGLGEFGFIASNKMKGELRQYEVKKDPLVVAEIIGAIRASKAEQAPARPPWALTFNRPQLGVAELKDKRCGYCPFNTTACWPGFEQVKQAGGVVFRGPQENGVS